MGDTAFSGLRACLLGVLFLCLFCIPHSPAAEETPSVERFQVQIGSAKDLKGTRWFAAKASRVLGEATYIVKGGSYYIVLTGYFSKKEQAEERLMQVRQHYNGMVVDYVIEDVLAAFDEGIEVPEGDFLDMLTSGERKRAAREKLRKTSPIRTVKRDEASSLREQVNKGLRNVTVDGCTLVASEELAGYAFRTSVPLAELDPYSLQTKEKHGENTYIVLEAKGGLSKIVTEQRNGGKVQFTRKDAAISLKPLDEGDTAVEKLATALQELITFCAR